MVLRDRGESERNGMLGLETRVRKDLGTRVTCEWDSVYQSEDARKCTREKEQAKHSTEGRVCVCVCASHHTHACHTTVTE